MQKRPSRTSEIRLAELVAALSIATDLGMGQPMEYVLPAHVRRAAVPDHGCSGESPAQDAFGLSSPDFDRVIAQLFLTLPQVMQESAAGHCEVAQRLASRFGFGESMQQALSQAYERWDGQGVPGGMKGEAIAASVRIVSLAQASSQVRHVRCKTWLRGSFSLQMLRNTQA